jgi:hypothetical protein
VLMNATPGTAGAGNTPKLPAGFAALGVGKGAQCMLCHNSRTGGLGLTGPDGKIDTTVNTAPYAPGSYLHEDNDPVFGANPTRASSSTGKIPSTPAYDTPHSPCQTDVLMGHNAYFMGDSGGNTSKYKSPHATIVDTCVNCHMAQTKPPQEFSDYENTNHVFRASLEICGTCHGVSMGLGEKLFKDHGHHNDVESQIDQRLAGFKQQRDSVYRHGRHSDWRHEQQERSDSGRV